MHTRYGNKVYHARRLVKMFYVLLQSIAIPSYKRIHQPRMVGHVLCATLVDISTDCFVQFECAILAGHNGYISKLVVGLRTQIGCVEVFCKWVGGAKRAFDCQNVARLKDCSVKHVNLYPTRYFCVIVGAIVQINHVGHIAHATDIGNTSGQHNWAGNYLLFLAGNYVYLKHTTAQNYKNKNKQHNQVQFVFE